MNLIARYFFFALMALFLTQSFEAQTLSLEVRRSEISQFLQDLASAESDQEEFGCRLAETLQEMAEPSASQLLNNLQAPILESNDLDLITLYQRAMRNFNSLSAEKTDPIATYYKHYQPPAFSIPAIDLTIDVADDHVEVTSKLTVIRCKKTTSLVLDGRDHRVQQVLINGQLVSREQYKVTRHELILTNLPDDDHFTVEIKSRINPFENETLEGMYLCKNWLTTQCESEGARRIFFTLDRPDVLSCITTTIIADKNKYPFRLSNGNLIKEAEQLDGRSVITWQDPFPKPSYLFACVLGNFSLLKSYFTTRSGKDVELQVYVEPGKESRAEYSLYALRKAMEFDELFFDREYDLSCLKMVGIPDFNSGAMENKGLMIFNDIALLVDADSGTDGAFRDVACVIGHEYFHNWSGNRVTIRNWFEIALKEAFTDWRAIRFGEWLFGEEFIRPKDVSALREHQFPQEYSEKGHPIMVESYVDAHSIYDSTTYVKGREVFRAFEIYVDSLVPGGFREVLNIYFSKNDGKAVTFRELLAAADEVLARVGKSSSQFERWFHQPGTPLVQVEMNHDPDQKIVELIVKQSCPHPKTGKNQKPFTIPFSIELLGQNGPILTRQNFILEEESARFLFSVNEKPSPLFMHGYSAPIILQYDYSLEDLARILKFTDDAFNRWEAGQIYARRIFKEILESINQNSELESKAAKGELVFKNLFEIYAVALQNPSLTPLGRVQLLQIPSVRALSQALNNYNFAELARIQALFKKQLALACKPILERFIQERKRQPVYEPISEQMQLRELYNVSLALLAQVDEDYVQLLRHCYMAADNFNDRMAAFVGCIQAAGQAREFVVQDFHQKWKNDKAVFNYWLTAQANSTRCWVEDLIALESADGFDRKNPNHIRSVVRAFTMNLGCYHDPEGRGYRYVVDKILEVSGFNPALAHNYLAGPALQDFDHLPASQKALMAQEMERLRKDGTAPPQTRDLVERMLKRYESGIETP